MAEEVGGETVKRLLVEGGACRPGGIEHYVGASDKHLVEFWDFEEMFKAENRTRLEAILFQLAVDISFVDFSKHGTHKPQVLVGPANGGNLICEALAPMLGELGLPVGVALTDKVVGTKEFTLQNPELVRGKRVLVIDDVMTSGISTKNTVRICREAGAEVVGIFVVVDRENRTAEGLSVPFYGFLLAVNAKSYDVPHGEGCSLCVNRIDINVNIGHGAEFVAKRGQPSTWSEMDIESEREMLSS